MKKILLTGFEAFAGNQTNPTQDLMLNFHGREGLKTLVLPVSFEHAWGSLEESIKAFKPDWVISCGVAAKRTSIDLERVALNFIDASIADNDGKLVSERVIRGDHPKCYLSDLPLNAWKNELNKKRAVSVSLSAGSYVCNYIYFQLMAHKSQYQYESLFIHFPYSSEAMGLEQFNEFLHDFIKTIDAFTSE